MSCYLSGVIIEIKYGTDITIDSVSFEGTAFLDWDSITVNISDSIISITAIASDGQYLQLPVEGILAIVYITVDDLASNAFIPLEGNVVNSQFIQFCLDIWVGGWNEMLTPLIINGGVEVLESETKVLSFDIKPGSCPNPLDMKMNNGKAVLPTAIVGTDYFDVNDIDPSTITLLGQPPVRWSYEDVSAPFDGEDCECSDDGPDGFDDLTLTVPHLSLAAGGFFLIWYEPIHKQYNNNANTSSIPLVKDQPVITEAKHTAAAPTAEARDSDLSPRSARSNLLPESLPILLSKHENGGNEPICTSSAGSHPPAARRTQRNVFPCVVYAPHSVRGVRPRAPRCQTLLAQLASANKKRRQRGADQE